MVTAPPVSESILGEHGRNASHLVKIAYCGKIIVSVSKDIHIGRILIADLDPTVLTEQQCITVINNGDSVARNDTVVKLGHAVHPVKSLGRALELLYFVAVMPYGAGSILQCDGKGIGGKLRVLFICKNDILGFDPQYILLVYRCAEFGNGLIAIEKRLARPVLKLAFRIPFYSNKPIGNK